MDKVRTVLAGLLIIVCQGCQRDLGVELPYEGNRLVVFGLISADSVVSVRIDKTAPPTGVFLYSDSVSDATATLFEDGVFVENLNYIGKETYRSPSGFKPKAGKAYFLKVTVDGFPPVETEPEVVPSEVKIEGYVFGDTIDNIFTGEARRLTFTFSDEQKEGDFYNAHIVGQYKGNLVTLNTFVAGRPLEASEDLCGFRSENNRYVLQDICFNGQLFSYNLGVATGGSLQEFKGPGERPRGQVKCDKILLRLMKISKAYRDYLFVADREQEGFFSAFTIPIREFTNIKGGYGLWAAYSEDVVDVLK